MRLSALQPGFTATLDECGVAPARGGGGVGIRSDAQLRQDTGSKEKQTEGGNKSGVKCDAGTHRAESGSHQVRRE